MPSTLAALRAEAVIITVGPWTPVYQGVDLASGQQAVEFAGDKIHQVLCFRVDLQAAGIELFTTPHCTVSGGAEPRADNTSHFVETFGVQAAFNGAFYTSSSGPSDSPLGTPDDVLGLAMSQGSTVSPWQNGYLAALLVKRHVGDEAEKNALEILQVERWREGGEGQSRSPLATPPSTTFGGTPHRRPHGAADASGRRPLQRRLPAGD